ncbi:MAG: hypothetical protein ACREIL_01830 [Nitrospiraceae bacterium]
MKQGSIGLLSVVLGMMILAPSAMAGTLVEFDGGIGVNGVSRVDGTASVGDAVRNIVRGVSPGGQPWVIRKFEAKVKENGDIKAEGKGLVLAGGNGIGRPPANAMVVAALFCGSDVPHSSEPVPLEPDGDFKIKDRLSPVPPDPCPNSVLLIRLNNSTGPWIAAGIPKLEEEDD